MIKKEKFWLVFFMLVFIAILPLILNQVRNKDVAMTAYVQENAPLKLKELNSIKINGSGSICYDIKGGGDCFNPLLKSPQYSEYLNIASSIIATKENYWGVFYYGQLIIGVPDEVKSKYSKDDVKRALLYVMSAIQNELNEKQKNKETWKEAK